MSTEAVLEVKVTGKWRGSVKVPESCTVRQLIAHIAAASSISEESQQLIFKGKKLLPPKVSDDDLITELGIKNKKKVYLALRKNAAKKTSVKRPVDSEDAIKKAAFDMRAKLVAQGAGTVSDAVAQQYVSIQKGPDYSAVKAIGLYYKTNGNVAMARQIARVDEATASAKAKEAQAQEDAAKKNATATPEEEPAEEEKQKKKKKKKKTYKEEMAAITMSRQTSTERRKAHKDHLMKNLGGGKFDQLDKL